MRTKIALIGVLALFIGVPAAGAGIPAVRDGDAYLALLVGEEPLVGPPAYWQEDVVYEVERAEFTVARQLARCPAEAWERSGGAVVCDPHDGKGFHLLLTIVDPRGESHGVLCTADREAMGLARHEIHLLRATLLRGQERLLMVERRFRWK